MDDEKGEEIAAKEREDDIKNNHNWEESLKEREEKMEDEEKERKLRGEKISSMEKSYELLSLCRKTLEEERETWKKTKERRDMERLLEEERNERLAKAGLKRIKTLKNIKMKETQTKITDKLKEIPENERKILEMKVEKERRMELKEAKEKLISRWRQNKGKKDSVLKGKDDQEELEVKLEKIEREIIKYKKELEVKRANEVIKEKRLEKKKRKLRHWEMMKWIVKFIEDNKKEWEVLKRRRKEDDENSRKRQQWLEKDKEDKIKLLKKEEEEKYRKKEMLKSNKEARLEEVLRMKENW